MMKSRLENGRVVPLKVVVGTKLMIRKILDKNVT